MSSPAVALLLPKTILAINTDADSPMMTRATYAVIGDMHEVVLAINEEIRRRRKYPVRGVSAAPERSIMTVTDSNVGGGLR